MEYADEIFLPVKGFEGKYEVSNYGRVKSIGGRERKNGPSFIGAVDRLGYMATSLRIGNKKYCTRIHTLVAGTFLAKPDTVNEYWVNHIDGNKTNNHVSNLEWITPRANCEHAVATGLHDIKGSKHPSAKISEADVIEIRELYKTCSQRYIAEKFNVGRRHLSDIITGKCWAHLPIPDYSNRPKTIEMYPRKPKKKRQAA